MKLNNSEGANINVHPKNTARCIKFTFSSSCAAGRQPGKPNTGMDKKTLLSHLHIVELGSVLAIPAVGMFFAECGARVTKVENPHTGGDVTRQWKLAAEPQHSPVSAYYASVNFGKDVVYIDLKTEEGYLEVMDLISSADIVLFNFLPSTAKRLKLDEASIRSRFPHVITGRISGYGKESESPAFDLLLQAETGFLAMTGTGPGQWAKLPVAFIDLFAAHQLKEGLLLALMQKAQTGSGSSVHVSLYRAAMAAMANQGSNWLNAGHDPGPMGLLHPNICPYGETLISGDHATFVLAAGTNKQFRALCRVLDTEHTADDPRFSDNAQRVKHRKVLQDILHQQSGRYNANELRRKLQAEDVPAALITPVSEAISKYSDQHEVLKWTFGGKQSKFMLPTAVFDIE